MSAELTYGPFSAAPDFAAKEAYLLNIAQGAVMFDQMVTGEILASYVAGEMTWDEAVKELEDLTGDDTEAEEDEG